MGTTANGTVENDQQNIRSPSSKEKINDVSVDGNGVDTILQSLST